MEAMLSAKYRAKSSRRKEMCEDLSILLGIKRSRQLATGGDITPNGSQNWRHMVGLGNRTEGKPPSSDVFGRSLTSSTQTTIDCVPHLIKSAQWRAASSTRHPLLPANTGWGIYSSRPAVRTSEQDAGRSTRVPMSSFFRHVQRPPGTPKNPDVSANVNNGNNEVFLQSPWVRRESTVTSQAEVTSNHSIQELIDIMCGDAQAPETLGTMSTSLKAINKRKAEEIELNNEAYALGTLKVARRPKTPKINLLPSYDELSTVSVLPCSKRPRSESVDLFSLDGSVGSTGPCSSAESFISGSPVLFEDEPFKLPLSPTGKNSVNCIETSVITRIPVRRSEEPISQPALEPLDLSMKTLNSKLHPLQSLSFNSISNAETMERSKRSSNLSTNYMDFERGQLSLVQGVDVDLCPKAPAPILVSPSFVPFTPIWNQKQPPRPECISNDIENENQRPPPRIGIETGTMANPRSNFLPGLNLDLLNEHFGPSSIRYAAAPSRSEYFAADRS